MPESASHTGAANALKRETSLLPQERQIWQIRLIKHLTHCTWFNAVNSLGENHLVITEDFLIKRLQNQRKKNTACKLATPDDFSDAIGANTKKVLVFCLKNELAIVRAIQKDHPKIEVTSGTYGYAMFGRDRLPKLHEFTSASAHPIAAPVIMLATRHADAEFIAKSMEKNGLPYFHEYLGRHYATWVRAHRSFQMARFCDTMDRRYSADGKTHYLLQTDVLHSMFLNTSFSLDRFVRYLERSHAKVILVSRRDKLTPAVNGQLLNRSEERSVWTKKPSKNIAVKYRADDMSGCVERQQLLASEENILATVAASKATTMEICLEDFIEDQPAGLASLAAFTETTLKQPMAMLDYDQGYELAPDLVLAPAEYKRQLVDKLGLHLRPLV